MTTVFIKPKAGLIVRDPKTKAPLAADGESKPASLYWLRRLRDGDVERARPPRKPKKRTDLPQAETKPAAKTEVEE